MNRPQNSLLERRREILSLPVDERASSLLEDPQSAELVRTIPGPDLYLTVIGAETDLAVRLLAHASVPQFQIFLDLDGWSHGRLDLERWCAWLEQASRATPRLLLQWLKTSDEETVVFLLSCILRIYKLDPSCPEDCWPPERPTSTLDGRYYFEAKPGATEAAFHAVLRALSDLRSQRSATYEALLEQVIWMIPNETEEAAYQNRASRLAACGFPELDESLEVWAADREAHPDRRRALLEKIPRDDATPIRLPARRTPAWAGRAFPALSEAAGAVDRDVQDRVFDELTHIGSRYAVASLTHLGDPETHSAGLQTALSHLNLGLQVLEAEGERQCLSAILRTLSVLEITRAGLGAIYQRCRRARDLLERGWLARVYQARQRLDPELLIPLEGLLRPHPTLSAEGEDDRPFRVHSDLLWIDSVLETIMAMGLFLETHVGAGAEEIPEISAFRETCRNPSEMDLRWSTVILTSLARQVRGEETRPLPFTADEWHDVVPPLLDGGTPPSPSRKWEEIIEQSGLDPARDLLATKMLEELGDEQTPQFDPRFVRSLLLVGG